jgi:IS605 OrfB family transposase
MTVRAIGSVVECFARDKRRTPRFRPHAAFPYDNRILRVGLDNVSIWTLEGRETIPFVCGARQRALLNQAQRIGECDLRPLPDGRWMLDVTVIVDAPAPYEPNGWLGVDLGVVNVATDTDGQVAAGGHLNGLRRRHRRLRGRLQRHGTRAARRLLRDRSGRERRFATQVNHCIAKELVCRAERTGRGIALEDLSGIRGRIRARRSQRGVLHSWAFRQLRELIAYKAQLHGVPVVYVDPRNTSRECPCCGHIEKRNRPNRDRFRCVRCGLTGHADYIAALNIESRAAVSRPNLTGVYATSHDAQSKAV